MHATQVSVCVLTAALSSCNWLTYSSASEGSWARVAGYFEAMRERADQASTKAADESKENALVYAKTSSGKVGRYYDSLSIDTSGYAIFRGGRAGGPYQRGETRLTSEELDALVRAIQQANFPASRQRYGRHAVVNEKSLSLSYSWNGKQAHALWMSPPAEPRPPDGWFRIVGILDPIWARAERTAKSHN